jgi:hypothetical protein
VRCAVVPFSEAGFHAEAALCCMKMHDCFDTTVRFVVTGIDNDQTKLLTNAFLVEENHA